MNLTQSDRDLAEKFAGPVLSIGMADATEEPRAQYIYANTASVSLIPYQSASKQASVLVRANLYGPDEHSRTKVEAGFDLEPSKALELGQKLVELAEAMLAQQVVS
jgi:hypothetical protein